MPLCDDEPLLVDLEVDENISTHKQGASLCESQSDGKGTIAMACLQAVCNLALAQRRMLPVSPPPHAQHQHNTAADFATARLGVAEAADAGIAVLPSEILRLLYNLSEELPQSHGQANAVLASGHTVQGSTNISTTEAKGGWGGTAPHSVIQQPSSDAAKDSEPSVPMRHSQPLPLQRGLKRNAAREVATPLQARQRPVAVVESPPPQPAQSASTSSSSTPGSKASVKLAMVGEELEAAINSFTYQVSSGQRGSPQAKRRCENDEFMRGDYEWCEDLRNMLRQRFGHADFRGLQLPVINAVLSRRDVFAMMPTGAGKSMCYQIPAMYRPGTAVVISPLLALMLDQVQGLQERGIAAARLGSDTKADDSGTFADLAAGRLQLLYVSPERMVSSSMHSERLTTALRELHRQARLSFFVIDEAHCVSQWGLDFRSQYRQLSCIRRDFPGVPIMALTASATEPVEKDVIKSLRMQTPVRMQDTFDRPNLFLEVRAKQNDAEVVKEVALLARSGGSKAHCGIVYALSRDDTQRLAQMLREEGITSRPYHAGLPMHVRNDAFEAWKRGACQVIVATVAFGMGIDKRDVRFVCHVSMTSSIERYHQEIGRAGRDGGPCRCIAWHSNADLKRLKNMASKQSERQKIDEACRFFTSADQCRRLALLKHFGERAASQCGACDVCARQSLGIARTSQEYDLTEAAKLLLELATSLEPHGFTAVQLRDTARGKQIQCKSQSLMQQAGDHPVKGKLSSFSVELVDKLIQEMHTLHVFREHRAASGKSSRKRRFFRAAILHVRLSTRAGQLRSGSLSVRLKSSEALPAFAAPISARDDALTDASTLQKEAFGTSQGTQARRNVKTVSLASSSSTSAQQQVNTDSTSSPQVGGVPAMARQMAALAKNVGRRNTPSGSTPACGQSPPKRARTIKAGLDDHGAVAFAKTMCSTSAEARNSLQAGSVAPLSVANAPGSSALIPSSTFHESAARNGAQIRNGAFPSLSLANAPGGSAMTSSITCREPAVRSSPFVNGSFPPLSIANAPGTSAMTLSTTRQESASQVGHGASSIANVPRDSATTPSTSASAEPPKIIGTGVGVVSNEDTSSKIDISSRSVISSESMVNGIGGTGIIVGSSSVATPARKPSRAAMRNQARQNPVEYDI